MLLSNVEGEIISIGMAIDLTEEEIDGSYGSFFEAFRENIQFTVLATYSGEERDPAMERECQACWDKVWKDIGRDPANHILFFAPSSSKSFSRWIQDYFMVFGTPKATENQLNALYHSNPDKPSSAFVTTQFADKLDLEVSWGTVNLAGGNILVYQNKAWIGKDVFCLPEGDCSLESQRINQLRKEIKLEQITPLGTSEPLQMLPHKAPSFQPFFHIDLYITLGGKTTNGEDLVFIADLKDENIVGYSSSIEPYIENIRKGLSETKARFISDGFVVANLPIVLHFKSNTVYDIYSYNNLLVEIWEDHKIAYQPNYQGEIKNLNDPGNLKETFARTNGDTSRVFASLGFKVKPVKGNKVDQAARSSGGIKCMTRVLERKL